VWALLMEANQEWMEWLYLRMQDGASTRETLPAAMAAD